MTTTGRPRPMPTGRPDRTYRGAVVAVGTRHGKQQQFAGPFADILGARLHTPADLDTDRFGTFSGEQPRRLSALDTARAKVRLALEVTGLPCGLASEASYTPLPGTGLVTHEEILLFCDPGRGIEVLEGHRGTDGPGVAHQVRGYAEVPAALLTGLPGQALIVRPAGGAGPAGATITKGVTDDGVLRAAVAAAVAASTAGRAIVEPDLRAHHNPSRRRVLRRLAVSMARRLATGCPACGTPGFGRVDRRAGLPCGACGTATPLTSAEVLGCCRCPYTEIRPVGDGAADPGCCPVCNP